MQVGGCQIHDTEPQPFPKQFQGKEFEVPTGSITYMGLILLIEPVGCSGIRNR